MEKFPKTIPLLQFTTGDPSSQDNSEAGGITTAESWLHEAKHATGIYVHIPFCFHKCHYCDFFSIANADNQQPAFIDAILEENAVVFALGDMPFVKSSSVNELISVQMNKKVGDVFVAGYRGRRGNPVLFRTSVMEVLKEGLRGDEGGNSILKDLGMDLVETGDRGVLFDIDTEEDLEDYAQ